MGINSNAIAAGSSDPASSAFPARAPGSSSGHVPDAANANNAASQSDPGSGSGSGTSPSVGASAGNNPSGTGQSGAAQSGTGRAASGQSGGAGSSSSAAQKTDGPSAQTRNTTRTRAKNSVTAAATPTPASDTPDAAAASGADFGSVMATALGRNAASTAACASSPAPANDPGPKTAARADQQAPTAAGASVDAIAWIAQALLPPATPAPLPVATSATDSGTQGGVGAVSANVAGGAQTNGTQPSATSVAASLARFNAMTVGQASAATPDDPQAKTTNLASTTASAGSSGLADLQKLISGMTGAIATAPATSTHAGADADADADAGSATPNTHSAVASDSNEVTQAAAALQAAALTRAADSMGSATLTIHAPLGSAAFTDEVGARIAGLAQAGITQAQLQLNPADLGPVQVHITMQAGQASVWFGATHADTRAALEQSLPRLRELFAGAGMPLTDSGVFREPPQQQPPQSLPGASAARISGSDTVLAPSVTQVSNIQLALLDTYA